MLRWGFEISKSGSGVSIFSFSLEDQRLLIRTDFPTSDHSALLHIERLLTSTRFEELYETIGLFDRNLREFTVLMEDMEQIAFSYSLSG